MPLLRRIVQERDKDFSRVFYVIVWYGARAEASVIKVFTTVVRGFGESFLWPGRIEGDRKPAAIYDINISCYGSEAIEKTNNGKCVLNMSERDGMSPIEFCHTEPEKQMKPRRVPPRKGSLQPPKTGKRMPRSCLQANLRGNRLTALLRQLGLAVDVLDNVAGSLVRETDKKISFSYPRLIFGANNASSREGVEQVSFLDMDHLRLAEKLVSLRSCQVGRGTELLTSDKQRALDQAEKAYKAFSPRCQG